MSQETTTDQPLMQKVVHTAVLTGVSALILSFFSFFGWLGVTMVKIQDNQTIIMQDFKHRDLKESKTVNVISAELFNAKQRIITLEQQLSRDTQDAPTKSKPVEDQKQAADPFDPLEDSDPFADIDDTEASIDNDKVKQQFEELQRHLQQQQQKNEQLKQQYQSKQLEQYQQQIQQQITVPPEQVK